MEIDFIQNRWSSRASNIDKPSIIIPNKRGKVYSIQYGGTGCHHCTIKGDVFKLPNIKFGEQAGTIFNNNLWYNQNFSSFFTTGFHTKRKCEMGRTFIYDAIQKEIEQRCTSYSLALWAEGKYCLIWHTPITRIKIVRGFKANDEAMMLVSFLSNNKLGYGVLTWQNCD